MIRYAGAVSCFVGVSLMASGALATDDYPRRKPGLWEITQEMSVMPGFKMQLEQCIDEHTDADFLAQRPEERENCNNHRIWRDGDRLLLEAVCKQDGSTVTINGAFLGSFIDEYVGEVNMKFSPPQNGMSEATMKMNARHRGDCKPGQNPGDVSISMPGMGGANGINIEELMKNMPR